MEFDDLRPPQKKAISLLRTDWKAHKNHLINAPCGFGKTALASYLAKSFANIGKRVVFVAPYVTLVDQTYTRFQQYGHTDLSVIWRDDPRHDASAMVQIASADTIIRRQWPKNCDVMIWDECHRMKKKLIEVMETHDFKTIGLTATPFSKWLGKYYTNFIKPTTTREMIELGWLTPFEIYAPCSPDMSKAKMTTNEYGEKDFSEAFAEEVMGDAKIVGNIVENWLLNGNNEPTIGFAPGVSTANAYTVEFRNAGISAEVVTAETPREEREVIFRRFAEGIVKIIWNVGVLGAGFDSDVRCIIWARPTKSETVWMQGTMRGSRPAPGKSTCVARGTKILTDKGLVKIEDVTFDHKVWDGVKFVSHGGSYCKGVKETIIYDGLCATPDHKVMTDYGWENFEEVAGRFGQIVNSGRGGEAIRVFENNFEKNRKFKLQSSGRGYLPRLRNAIDGKISQHAKEAKQKRMPNLQGKNCRYSSTLVIRKMQRSAAEVPKPIMPIIRTIWRERDTVQIQKRKSCIEMGNGKSWDPGKYSNNGAGQNRQQWTLRSGKFEMVVAITKHAKSKKFERHSKEILPVPVKLSKNQIFRRNAKKVNSHWVNRRANNREILFAFSKAKRQVWDIHNCGDLQRFTANDKLVHNCTLFDHSGTYLNLGDPCDIEYFEMYSEDEEIQAKREKTKEERQEKIGKVCSKCNAIKDPGEYQCKRCGHKPLAGEFIEEIDESRNIVKVKGKVKAKTQQEKEQFYRQLKGYQLERAAAGKPVKDGYISWIFKDWCGVFPKGLNSNPMPVGVDVRNFIKHKNIKFAKSQKKNENK